MRSKIFLKFTTVLIFCVVQCALFAKPPSIMFAYPAGGSAGSTFKAIIGALDADTATAITISGKGVNAKILKITEMPKDRQQAAAKRDEAKGMKFVEVEISIAKDAPNGVRDLKLISRDGASSRYFFSVENIPEICENKVSNSFESAQEIKSLPCVINGQIYEGQRDFYKFNLIAKKTYVFDMHGRQIRPYLADAVPGWFQPTLRLYDENKNTVAYVDDFQNSPDPILIFTPQKSGVYTLETKDSLYRGRDDFVYRLRCGELPIIQYIFPCGGNKSKENSVEVFGVNLRQKKIKIPPTDSEEKFREVFLKEGAYESNRVKFCNDTFSEKTLRPSENPSDEISEIPCIFNGKITSQYQKFFVNFKAKKGDELNLETFSSRLGYPVDTKLTLFKGSKKIAENDDIDDSSFGLVTAQFDSRIIQKFTEDGIYTLMLEESKNMGGQDYVFRLKISAPEKQIDLNVSPSNPQIAKGSYAPLRVVANKRGGWNNDIEIVAKGLPNGFSAEKCVISKGKNSAYIIIKADKSVNIKNFSPTFVGKAEGLESELPAKASEELTQAFFISHTLPVENIEMNVVEKAPFNLEWVNLPNLPISVNAGNTEELTLKITNLEGFKGKFRIQAYRNSPGLQIQQVQANDSKDTVEIRFRGNPNAVGRIDDVAFVMATYSKNGKTYMTLAPPITYRVHGRVQLNLTKKK